MLIRTTLTCNTLQEWFKPQQKRIPAGASKTTHVKTDVKTLWNLVEAQLKAADTKKDGKPDIESIAKAIILTELLEGMLVQKKSINYHYSSKIQALDPTTGQKVKDTILRSYESVLGPLNAFNALEEACQSANPDIQTILECVRSFRDSKICVYEGGFKNVEYPQQQQSWEGHRLLGRGRVGSMDCKDVPYGIWQAYLDTYNSIYEESGVKIALSYGTGSEDCVKFTERKSEENPCPFLEVQGEKRFLETNMGRNPAYYQQDETGKLQFSAFNFLNNEILSPVKEIRQKHPRWNMNECIRSATQELEKKARRLPKERVYEEPVQVQAPVTSLKNVTNVAQYDNACQKGRYTD